MVLCLGVLSTPTRNPRTPCGGRAGPTITSGASKVPANFQNSIFWPARDTHRGRRTQKRGAPMEPPRSYRSPLPPGSNGRSGRVHAVPRIARALPPIRIHLEVVLRGGLGPWAFSIWGFLNNLIQLENQTVNIGVGEVGFLPQAHADFHVRIGGDRSPSPWRPC